MRLEGDFNDVSENLYGQEEAKFNEDTFYQESMGKAIKAKSTAFERLKVIKELVKNKENEHLLKLVIDKVKNNKLSASKRQSLEAAEPEEINLKNMSIVKASPELIGSLLLLFFSALPINVNLR